MRILIAYASKTGTAKEGAELLATLLNNHNVTLADLDKTVPVAGDFDYVVLGGSIRAGRAHKALRRYLKNHAQAVAERPHTLFLCCGFAEQFENYLESVFPSILLESAEDTVYFGGVLDVARQRGLDKLIARLMRNAIRESEEDEVMLPGLMPEHIRMLADRLRIRQS